jgi:hypothetical protein
MGGCDENGSGIDATVSLKSNHHPSSGSYLIAVVSLLIQETFLLLSVCFGSNPTRLCFFISLLLSGKYFAFLSRNLNKQ